MHAFDLFVGKRVWLKPNPLYVDKYLEGYFETTITKIGTSCFFVNDPNRPAYVKYHIKTLKEVNVTPYKGEIILDKDGAEEFDKKEQLIIKIRRFFNSRAAYNEDNEKLKNIISLLKL